MPNTGSFYFAIIGDNSNTLVAFARKKNNTKPLRSHHKDLSLVRKARGTALPGFRQLAKLKKVLSKQESRLLRTAGILFVVGLFWLGADTALSGRAAEPAVGGRFVEAMVGSPQYINPVFASVSDTDADISALIFSGLMRYDANQELVPDLAESYTISDDGLSYTFILKENARFHDGEPVTAGDVQFTIETIQNPDVGSPLAITFRGVQIEQVDDRTITFTLAEPFPSFLGSLTVGVIPEHVWGAVEPERMRLHSFNLSPIGTGPFKFDSFSRDETGTIYRYELARNAEFYRTPAYIEEFVFQFYTSYDGNTGAIQALRSQRADALSFVPSDLIDEVRRKHIRLETLQLPQYSALYFNQDQQPLLADIAVREALSLAIDKQRVVSEVLSGEGEPVHSPLLPGHPGFMAVEADSFDQARAEELLVEAGFTLRSPKEYERIRTAALSEEFGVAPLAAQIEEAVSTDVQQEITEIRANTSTTSVDGRNALPIIEFLMNMNAAAAIAPPEQTTSTTSTEPTVDIAALQAELASRVADVEAAVDAEMDETQTVYMQHEDGEFLEIVLVTADTPEYRETAGLIEGYWQDIGVRVAVEFIPPREMSRDVLRNRKYDVLLYGAIIGGDPDQFALWHSSQVDYPGLNLARYASEEADALLEQIRETEDMNAAKKLYEQFTTQIITDRPAVFLYRPTYTYALGDRVEGFIAHSIFLPSDRYANVTDWYVQTSLVWE